MNLKYSNPEDFLFHMTYVAARQATCPRREVGCIIVDRAGNLVSMGYNGAPPGLPTCLEEGCLLEGGHCVRAVHAEIRALANAARNGIRVEGFTAYCTLLPCIQCMQALVLAGIGAVYYDEEYERSEKSSLKKLAVLGDWILIRRKEHGA